MPDMTRFSERAFLGVSLANTDDGVRIEEVLSDSAAEEAGLQTGDIITAIGDSAVSTVREAQSAVNAFEPGDDVSVSVSRDGEALDLTVTLGSTGVGTALEFRAPFGDLRYNSETNSIEIGEISEDSALYELGLRSGDAITAINGEELSPAGLMGLLATLDEDASLILSVERDGEAVELEIAAEDLTRIGPLFFGFRGGQGIPFDLFGDEGVPFQFRFRGDSDGRGFFNMPGGVQLGVAFITLDEQVAGQQDIDQTEGALITEVLPESPADLAGLQVDDVILAVDGDVLDSERTLRDRLVAYEPGDVVTLDILRGGESLQIEVTLGQVELSSDFMPFGQGQGFHFNIPGDLFGPDGRFEFDGPHGFFNGPDGGFHFNLPDITAVKPDV
jgi:S1-C subfamily serine protease